MKVHGVNLVISSCHISDLVTGCCHNAGIHIIQCVEEEDIVRLMMAYGGRIMYTPEELSDTFICGEAKTCANTVVNGKKCVHFDGDQILFYKIIPCVSWYVDQVREFVINTLV